MIIQADILKWAATYTGPKFHALLSDPPYHLTSGNIVFDWSAFGAQPDNPKKVNGSGSTNKRGRGKQKGFMGRDWDGLDENGQGIAFRPDTWAAIAEHLYPGAWGMAFAGSRGWHRMAVAIEDAGLIMQPTIFGWSYGSGFPKATRIDTQIDAQAFREWLKLHPVEQASLKAARDAERAARRAKDRAATKEIRAQLQALTMAYKASAGLLPAVLSTRKQAPKFDVAGHGAGENTGYNRRVDENGQAPTFDVLDCATEAARYWLGHRYGGQALKPALEPIIVFQKPYAGSPLSNITSTGAGALWIDGGRIPGGDIGKAGASPMVGHDGWDRPWRHDPEMVAALAERKRQNNETAQELGRWPANLILSHSPACNGTCAPGCPVAALGAQSGEIHGRTTSGPVNMGTFGGTVQGGTEWRDNGSIRGHDDTGTAARFFYQADYMLERLELADAIAYVAKASRGEREAGLDPRQTAIMRLLDDEGDWEDIEDQAEHIVYAGDRHTVKQCPEHGASRGPNSTYKCGCTIERRAQFDATTVDDGRETPIDNPYQRGETTRRNTHPTIKPISLTRYLATLLLPPPEYGPRRLLIPFSGAGSEIIGADLAGWEDVTGIELEAEHVAIANARRAYWQQRRWELGDPARKLSVKAAPAVPAGQVDMFESEAA